MGLASEWRFEKRDRKFYIGSSESSITTNLVKTRIDKSQGDSLFIVYGKVDDSIDSSG